MTDSHKGSYNLKITSSFIMLGLILLSVPWIPIYLETIIGPTFSFYLILVLFMIFGWFSGLGEGTVFLTVGSLPSKYMGAIMLGRGVSGLFSNLLSLATLPHIFDFRSNFASITFFTVSGICALFASTFYCLILKKNECFMFYVQDVQEAIKMAQFGKFCTDTKITESEAQDIKVRSFRGILTATKRQFTSTRGLLYTSFFVYFMTYSVFPVVIFTNQLKCVSSKDTS